MAKKRKPKKRAYGFETATRLLVIPYAGKYRNSRRKAAPEGEYVPPPQMCGIR